MSSPDSGEVQRVVPWPFEDGRFPSRLGAVVMRTVLSGERPALLVVHFRPITDEGVAVGGAFDSDTATGMMPAAQRVAGVLAFQ
jgi:hypothetical protein